MLINRQIGISPCTDMDTQDVQSAVHHVSSIHGSPHPWDFHTHVGSDDGPITNPSSSSLPFFFDAAKRSSEPNNDQANPSLVESVPDPGIDLASEPVLCKEQQDLINLMLTGRNVFYTGSAGCGKSTVLKAAVKTLGEKGLRVHVVAPTGKAALQINGMTTWSYMGWTPDYHRLSLAQLKAKGWRQKVAERLKETDVLIIDEISMVENHHLERINVCMKEIRCRDKKRKRSAIDAPAFGGVQLIVAGDFCQLPPVKPFEFCIKCGQEMIADADGAEFNCPKGHGPFSETDKWAFQSEAWREANFAHVELKDIHRQNDHSFIKLLQKCRLDIPFLPDEMNMLMYHDCDVRNATRLLCTKREVSEVNSVNFHKLKTPIFVYHALDGFEHYSKDKTEAPPREYLEYEADGTLTACKQHRLEPKLRLRAGMPVILLVNIDIKGGLVNGSQGIISGYKEMKSAGPYKTQNRRRRSRSYPIIGDQYLELKQKQIEYYMNSQTRRLQQEEAALGGRQPQKRAISTGTRWPQVSFHNGRKITIPPVCIVNTVGDSEPYSLLHRTQIPLIPGWAMTIHRSQGMTLDRAIVNLSKAFEEGQVYVALSRARCLEGLKVEGHLSWLNAGHGGNPEVHKFLREKFGIMPGFKEEDDGT